MLFSDELVTSSVEFIKLVQANGFASFYSDRKMIALALSSLIGLFGTLTFLYCCCKRGRSVSRSKLNQMPSKKNQ